MSAIDLAFRLEDALASLASAVTSATVLTGVDDGQTVLPRIVCVVGMGEENPLGTGLFGMPCKVVVCSDADAGVAAHGSRVGTVFDVFCNDAIVSALNAASGAVDVTAIASRRVGATYYTGAHWQSSLEFTLWASTT